MIINMDVNEISRQIELFSNKYKNGKKCTNCNVITQIHTDVVSLPILFHGKFTTPIMERDVALISCMECGLIEIFDLKLIEHNQKTINL